MLAGLLPLYTNELNERLFKITVTLFNGGRKPIKLIAYILSVLIIKCFIEMDI